LRYTVLYSCAALCVLSTFAVCALSQAVSLGEWKLARTVRLKGPSNHVQGIDFDAHILWVTSVDPANHKGYLREFSLSSGEVIRGVEVQDGDRFHPGGIATDMGSVWLPVAEYRPHSISLIEKRSKRTLGIEAAFSVPDHIGCVAATAEYLIGGNWDSREFYVWDHAGQLVRKVANTTDNAYQDMKFEGGLLIASGVLPDRSGAIDWIEFPSFRLARRLKVGNTERQVPFTREGMAIRRKQLLLLPEDDPSRVFIFAADR
jgi:hypothetical protein